jgi:hypothetical protein
MMFAEVIASRRCDFTESEDFAKVGASGFPSPLGEGGAKRRVRGAALSIV